MGSFGDIVASQGMQFGMQGLSIGMSTGSGIANAMYNAAAARMRARAINAQSDLQAYLIREQYASEYKQLQESQARQQSMNRVLQAKHGITGASADVTMQSYAAKAQKNLEVLYYNAAMSTGKQSMAASAQRAAMLEKARQYDWQAWQTGVAGVVNLGAGMLSQYGRQKYGTTETPPYMGLEIGKPDAVTQALAEMQTSASLHGPDGYTAGERLMIAELARGY